MAIVLENKNVYTIDILDGHGNLIHQIKFNLDDVNLTGKVIEFYNEAQKTIKEIEERQEKAKAKLEALGVEEIKQVTDVEEGELITMPDEFKEFYDVQIWGFQELRRLIDDLLGYNTCNKIFGEVNSYEMFETFINGLVPEFEKMGIKIQNMKKQLFEKYNKKDGKVLK